MTKEESLQEISMAAITHLQIGDTLLKNSEAMKVNIRSSSTLEVHKIKVIGLGLVESGKEGNDLIHRVRNGGKLLPISNQEIRATSARDKPKKKHKIQHDFVRNKQGKEMNVTMKALIKDGTREIGRAHV